MRCAYVCAGKKPLDLAGLVMPYGAVSGSEVRRRFELDFGFASAAAAGCLQVCGPLQHRRGSSLPPPYSYSAHVQMPGYLLQDHNVGADKIPVPECPPRLTVEFQVQGGVSVADKCIQGGKQPDMALTIKVGGGGDGRDMGFSGGAGWC